MRKLTLFITSLFLFAGTAWAQLADGVYTISNTIQNRGTMCFGTTENGTEYFGLAGITLGNYGGNSVTVADVANKYWYVKTVDNKTYIYNVGKGQFLQGQSGNVASCGATCVGFTMSEETHGSTSYALVNSNNQYLAFSCGWQPDQGQIRWTSYEKEACCLTFTLVDGAEATYKEQIGAATIAINKVTGNYFATPKAGKFYKIKGEGQLPWLTAEATSAGNVKVSVDETAAGVFYKTANGIQAVATGKYLGYTGGKYTYSETALTIELLNTGDYNTNYSNKYTIVSGGNYMFNNNTDGIVHESNRELGKEYPHLWAFTEVAAPAATVNGVIYETLAAAVEVVEAGQTLTLWKNTDETFVLPMGVELNKNGFTADNVTVTQPAAKIGETPYATLADALTAAAAMTGDVTVELYNKVTFNQPLTGNYTSINFVGKDTDAEMYLDVQGYTTATGKKVSFTDLKLSKSEGGFIANAGFMNVAFGIYDVEEVTYTNCTFENGACASSGKVTFNGCTFKKSWDKYGLWAYGNVDVTVQGSTFADYRGIKMYAENGAAESVEKANLTVKNTNFSAVDNKPAIVLTYGESVVLEGNTYSSTGTFELDLDGQPNGVAVTSDVAPTCKNDNGACGVLVDGKIYTTVAQAAEVATSSSTVTLLHSSTETVEFPMGTTIEKNGFTADNVTTAQPFAEYVVLPISMTVNNYKALFGTNTVTDGTNYYATLQAAVEAVAKNAGVTRQANAILYCKPGADVGSLQHAPVVSTLTINGNGANVTGGSERDFDLGNTDPSAGKDITADMTLTVKHLNGCGAWGAKATEHTVNLVFENCANMGKVFITGTTGTLNITMNDCAFEGVLKEAVYSNADGAITLNNVAFSNLNKAINLNHKAAGTQTVTINGCSFTDCGADVAADQIPVRVLSSVDGGKSVLNVSNTTFTGTPEGGADILLDYAVGETTASVTATAANVFVEKENNVATKTTVTESEGGEFTNVVPVAKVNGIEYMTLAKAVAAAQAGDEIVLIADVKTTDGVVITDKNLTIDLNGKTYTVTEGANTNNRNFKINGTSVVTVKNGTMVAAGEYSSGAYGTIRTEGTANVTLTGLKLYNNRGNGLNIKACAGTTVTIENTEIYANYGGGIESAGGTIVVNNGVIVEQKGMYTAPYNSMAISVNGGGKVTVNGGTFSTECLAAADANNQGTSHGPWVAGVLNSGGTLIINGGTFSNDNFGDNSLATHARGAILADTKAKVEIYGGTFNVLKNVIDIQNNLGDANNNPSVLLVGGTYSADPRTSAQYGSNLITLAEDYIAVKNNGVWNVVKAAAKIGEQGYATLEAAFAAAAEGQTITLLADATPALTSQRAITKAAVIDLGGKTLTLTEDDLYFGTTTFKNGTIVVDPSVKPSTAVFWMFANQTLTFDNVKVVATGVTGTYLIGLDGNNSDLNLLNGSEILVENTTALDLDIICVNASTGNDIKVENSKVNVTNLDGRVFFRGNYTVAGNSEINLDGITKAGFRIEAGQTLSIEGTSVVNIEGELRDGGIHLTDLTATYTKAETATVNATLNEVTPAAVIGTQKFASLQAAVNAVKNDETITLTSDVTENVTLTEKVGLYYTIDGADKTMNGKIVITPLSDTNDNRRITIKGINFVTTEGRDFITSTATNHYPRLTVEGCSFTGTGKEAANTVAIRLKSSHSVVIKDCTGTGLHSFLQNTSGWNLTIENVKVTDSKSGFALGTVQGVTVKGCEIAAEGYGIRLDAGYNNNAVIESNTVKAFIPVVVRKAEVNSNVTVQGTNTFTATNTDGLWMAVGTSEYETNGSMPTAATGQVVVTLNDTNLNREGIYGNALAGEGTEAKPFLIHSVKELEAFRSSVNAGETKYNAPGVWVALAADIDLANAEWTVGIGDGHNYSFDGNFDGKNHTIKNLNIKPYADADKYLCGGLFGYIYGGVTIKDLVIENVTITAEAEGHNVGILVGFANNNGGKANISNITVKGDVKVNAPKAYGVGAIVGYSYREMGAITNCQVVANDGSYIKGQRFVGGITGYSYNNAVITDCIVKNLAISGAHGVAGIAGLALNGNKITNCTVETVTVEAENNVAYIVGELQGEGGDVTVANNNAPQPWVGGSWGSGESLVATIGTQYFTTIAKAIEAAKVGDVISLIADVTASDIITINKAITLDGNGKTLTSTAGRAINVDCEGNVGIKNLTINASGERAINVITKPANVTIENVTATAANYTVNVAASAGAAKVAISKSTLNGLCTVNVAAAGAQVTIDNSTVNCNDNNTTAGESYAALCLNKAAVGASIVATNTTVNVAAGSDSEKGRNGAENGTVTINGSTEGVTVTVAVITYPGSDNYYGFTSLAAAIEFAKAGDVVTLIRDVEASDIITINKTITLDGNGKKLTSTAGRAINVSGADGVTIKNLTINASGERAINVIQNATNVTIDGVTATAANYTVNVAASAPAAVVAINNSTLNGLCTVNVAAAGANVTVDNSTVNCNDNNTTAGESYAALSLNKEAVGGSIVATNTIVNVAEGSDSMQGRNGAENGTVTINGKTEGVAEMVAAITYEGSTAYHAFATLKAAIEFAKEGDAITLIRDVTMDYNARDAYETQAQNVVINGNGKTLTLNQKNSDWASFGLANNSKLVLNNMTIEKTGYGDTSGAWNTHAIIFSCPVEMSDVTVNNSVAVQAGATLNNVAINEANGYYGLWINGNGQEVTVNGGSITATNGGRGIKIADQYIDNPAQVTLNVDGTVFNTAKKSAVLVSSKAGAKIAAANVNITNVAEDNVNFVWVDEDWAQHFGNVEVTGATVRAESAAAFTAAITANGAVQAYYKTLAEAINAAQAGATVELLADVEASEVILVGKSLTINGNDHKVTSSATRVFRVTTSDTEVTLNNVNMVSTAVRVGTNDVRGISIDIVDNVKLTLNNSSVDFTDASANDWAYAVNVTGGNNHVVIVNGGTYEGANVINVRGANNTVTVKDAVITCTYPNNDLYAGACIWVLQNQGSSVEATGNTFNGSNAVAFNLGTGTGLTASNNTDNTVKVVAKIGAEYYTSLAEAFAAAEDGATIKVLQNAEVAEAIVVNKKVVIDLNGKKVTSTAKKAFEVYADATIQNGTIEAAQRCVDTRKAVELTLTDVTLVADKYTSAHGNPQPLTIGGSENGTKVTMTNVNISAAAGYGIITFVKTELTATESTIGGYNALYVKPGSDNSVFNFVDSDLSGSTVANDVEGNSFSVIAVRANNVTVNVDAASTVDAAGSYSYAISFKSSYQNEAATGSSVTVAGTITGNILTALNGNTVRINAEYADELQAAGYATSVADGLATAKAAVAKIGDTNYATLAEAIKAAKAGDTVIVFEGTYAMPSVKAGITIVGEGNVVFEGTLTGSLENLTMKNIHIKGGNAQRWAYAKGNLVFENVTFEATSVYALHFDGITEGTNLTYKNCTIIGWAALGGSPASCKFEGCTFKGNGTYGLIRTYFDTTIDNCTFDVANVNTTDNYQDGIHAVEGANVTVTSSTNANGDMKAIVNVHGSSVVTVDGTVYKNVAKVGDTQYITIDDAIEAWTNGTTLTLLADVTLSDVIKLKSTEHHTLNLGTYTMTAASGKNAIEITCEGLSNATYAITVNADANNPGGITATGKACIYYSKSGSTKDRPIIRIYNGVFNGSYSINSKSNGNTNCPQIWIYGGTFNGNVNLTKNMLRVFGGTFNGWINCTGDSSAYREISGGTFKSWQFMTADADNKFWVGTSKANYNVGVYVDDNGYLVVGGDVVKEPGNFEASSANYGGWSSYLKYSSAKDNGLYYTSVKEAFADNNTASGKVTVYADEIDMAGITYKGSIIIPAGESVKINNAPADLKVATAEGYFVDIKDGVYESKFAVAKIGEQNYASLAEALTAAQSGDIVTLLWKEGQAPLAMNGSVFGKNVTIKGTAKVDWSKGFLFVGRGGEGDATVTFDEANLTSASNSASYGIHVSGREKDTNNKYNGTLVINNSTIELDYLINKGAMTLDKATLTVKNGFAIGGRPASETESGADATATISLTNGSKVVVNNHNGMGLGYEAIGVMNIDATSTFETTQSFLVTAKGTMNVAGTAKVEGTLTNNGAIVLTAAAATLTSTECGNVTTNVADHKVVYADGAYKVVAKNYVAKVGDAQYETLSAALAAAEAGATITLVADVTEDVTTTKAVIIEGAGKTYTGAMTLKADATFKNVNFDGKGYNGYAITTRGANYLTIEGCTAKNYGYGFVQLASGTALTTVKDVTVSNVNYGVKVDYSNKVVLDNVDITAGVAALLNSNYGEKTITIKDSKLNILGTWKRNDTVKTTYVFEGENIVDDFTKTVPALDIFKNAAQVVGTTAIYGDLNAAFAAVESNGTVKLLGDFTTEASATVPAGKVVTLDLNGKTIAGTDNETKSYGLININSGAELTINGEGAIQLTAANNRGWNAYSSVISNQRGKLIVNGGTIEHLGGTDMAYAIDNLTNGKGTYAETVINGGLVKSPYRAIRQFLNGTEAQNILTVNGGTIEGTNKSIWMQEANANANNGALTVAANAAIKGNVYLSGNAAATEWPINVAVASAALKDGAQVLTSNAPADYYLMENNGVWGVIYDRTYGKVAYNETTDVYYATLAEALAAVQVGDNTIKLLADCAENVTITQVNGTNIVINGNGKTYTGTITVKGDKVTNNLYNTETLTFQNINFAPAYGTYAITAEKNTYARNITVDGCTFKGNNDVYGIRVRNGYNYTVKNTTAEGVYTFFNASEALTGLTVENVTVKCANVAFAGAYGFGDASFKEVTVVSDNNGVKVNNPNSSALTFENCSITAKAPVTFYENAGVTSALTAEFNGTNTMVVNNGGTYWFNIVEADATDATFKAIVNDANLDMSNTAFAASVGNVYYSNLTAAVNAAADGATVVVARDIELDAASCVKNSDGYSVFVNVAGKAITIDLNGKAVTANLSADQFASAKSSLLMAVLSVDTNGNLTLNDSKGTGKVAVTANDASVYSLISNYDSSSKLTINGGSYELDEARAKSSLIHSDPSEAVVVNGGNFYLGNVNTGVNNSPWIFNVNGNNTGHVIVNGGTFNYDINHQYWAFEVHVDKTSALQNNGNGTWTVVPAVAYVIEENNGYTREAGCASLADAFASKYGSDVTMLVDVELSETVSVPAGKEVVLDLNGKIISANIAEQLTKSFAAIQNRGTLTIKDASAEADGKISVSYAGNSFGYGVGLYTISNEGGVLNIEGGTIENTTDVSGSMYDAIDNNSTLGETVLNISGGEVVCGKYIGVRLFANNTTYNNIVNVTDGKVVGGNTSIWVQNPGSKQPLATVAISGADYENGNYPVIEGRLLAGESTGFNFEVTGGLFDTDVNAFCAADYASYNFGNGTWGVEYLILEEFVINHGEYTEFENRNAKTVAVLTYNRTISKKNLNVWQALYVPFEIPVSELGDDYDVAYFNDFRETLDADGNIVEGKSVVELVKINSGKTLKANHPYVIRAKNAEALEMSLTLYNVKLYSTVADSCHSVECSSATKRFEFFGTYKQAGRAELTGNDNIPCYAMGGGTLGAMPSDEEFKLNPFLIYMTKSNKDGSPYIENATEAHSIPLRLIGEEAEDGTTIIYDVEMDEQGVDYIYDLQGRRVLEPQKGSLYIINGKKVVF